MDEKCIIDRFEGDYAVIEYGRITFNLPRSLLPKEAKEGDILTFDIHIDKEETKMRSQRIKKLADELFRE
ncbi:DUF3006 domain-containing protein [Thermoanaerobacterium thermosaccharolyticum]|uniref:Pyruvate kinase n=1 Tax=Thermoanaerobacterium thermosaccharolyticum TaxID=1517 RepID=A0A231VJH3_THETR|nr:DUF3006 domain-containing protein [Thermoanaerobacterium thermosaccharolyticum]AST56624.1 pyruvate kinase [Thermoanaerobacterium thermosaccharolyticum]MBE0069355.1 DUF3006 domain-containing protein [Thermoanaerobacterium thermosaccharolyticum]MBE0229431.1 DUF3006 domain-containing protein [Thermoanaerobacterium thermosaccharolyticum]MCP2239930.1 hypothetical protein [Thermoanaerobacterium thermosaccharolyticum]OXT08353.1 hypothetical protein CE561_05325 [Thermoanaerobacterium thermosaccharo